MPQHILFALALMVLVGCSSTQTTHGQIIPEENLAMLEAGQHDKLAVLRYLGSPSSETPFSENQWLYITTRTADRPFRHDEVLERKILIVEFDDNDRLANIREVNQEQGRALEPLPRYTETQGQSLGILDQMLNNLGSGFARSNSE